MAPLTELQLLDRVLQGGTERPTDVARLFAALDWRDTAPLPVTVDGADMALEARAAAQPRAVVVVGRGPESARAASVSYSREAPYLVLWGDESIQLHEVRLWTDRPGDTPLYSASVHQREGLTDLLQLLRRPEVLSDVPGALGQRLGTQHSDLPHCLADAVAALRLQAVDAQGLAGANADTTDAAVLAYFHQLLYMRVVEDRRSTEAPERVEQLLDGIDLSPRLERLGEWYATALDSELFAPSGVQPRQLPADALLGVLRALVEPWQALRLDFSVTQAELAGRLYESYLASVPVLDNHELRLFPSARALDRRDVQASFYTPPGLAKAVVDRTLGGYTRSRDVDPFSIRVLDPACGSGAFLLAAFRWLRAYARQRLGRDLTSAERAHLLVACLFGADVDDRALALTRVQLFEEAQIIGRLPSLASNLFHGDALVSPPGAPAASQTPGAVSWSAVLEEVGPFSAIIGNPPFGSEAKLPGRMSVASIRVLDALFPEVRGFGRDYAYLFGALALRLLSEDGVAGFVMPRKLLEGASGRKLRALLADRGVDWIADLRAVGLFPGVKTRACAIVVNPRAGAAAQVVSILDSRQEPSRALDDMLEPGASYRVPRGALRATAPRGWSAFRLRWELELRTELSSALAPLAPESDTTRDVRFGTKPARVDKLVLGRDEWRAVGANKVRVGNADLPARYLPQLVYARDIRPFVLRESGRRLLLPFEPNGEPTRNPAVVAELERRGGLPRNFQRGDLRTLLAPKVLLRAVAREPAAVPDLTGTHLPIMRGALAIRVDGLSTLGLVSLAAILNSALYQWLIRGLGAPLHDESVELAAADIRALPMPEMTEHVITAVSDMSADVLTAVASPDPYTRARKYRSTRHELDLLVFELTGCTARLRGIVLDELLRDA